MTQFPSFSTIFAHSGHFPNAKNQGSDRLETAQWAYDDTSEYSAFVEHPYPFRDVFDPPGSRIGERCDTQPASTHTFPKFFHRTQLSDRARDRLPRAVGRQGQPCDSN
jgi:hypothetical protein